MPAIEWIKPGLATMVQGCPYRGLRHQGMPLAGPADMLSLSLANWQAGNASDAPAIETAYAPLAFKVFGGLTIGVAGAATQIVVNGKPHPTSEPIIVHDADIIEIPAPKYGCRSYIAVSGGIPVEERLGATSTYQPAAIGGSTGLDIKAGGSLELTGSTTSASRILPQEFNLSLSDHFILRFVAATEHLWLNNPSFDALTHNEWGVSQRSDRMGLQLEGPQLAVTYEEQLQSSAVFPGTIQLPPSGKPFLLGPDAQTTGGYPRIAQIIRADRHLIGQLRPGAKIRLQHVKPAEAQSLYRSKLGLLRKLQPDIRLD